MSGKRTGKSTLRIFMTTLLTVLTVGGAAMMGYSAMTERAGQTNDKNGKYGNKVQRVVDFSELGQSADMEKPEAGQPYQSADGETGEPDSLPQNLSGAAGELQAEDERLYQEALGRGENAYLIDCADSVRVTFAFAGDILLDDSYAMMARYRSRGSDINDTFSADLLERMRGADVFMLNNEFPFSTRGTPTEGKTFTFRASPANVGMYGQIGVDIVSLANNHAYDYGEDALLDTFATLEDAGIPYVGAGRTLEDARKPVYLIANGMKVGIVSATQIERNAVPDTKEATATSAGVLRCMDPSALLGVIAEAEANSDFVILYIHWGTESQEETDWLQDKQAPVYAEAGVDLIIGDHPHCLQKLDVVSGVPVVYSLGNYWFNSKTQNTCLVEVGLRKEGMEYLRFVPCIQEDCRTRQLEGTRKEDVLNYMRGLSPNVNIDDDGYVTFKSYSSA